MHKCCWSGVVVTMLGVAAEAQIAEPILPGLTVEIQDVLQLPDTRGQGSEDRRVADNLARINFMRAMPNTGQWMVNDLRGQMYVVNPNTKQTTTYLDFDSQFDDFIIGPGGLSTGLLSFAFAPDFASSGRFYTLHEEDINGGNFNQQDFMAQGNPGTLGQYGVLTEWVANDPSANVFSGTHRELMRVAQPSGNVHNFGDLGFNPLAQPGDADYGMLYVAGGDGGHDAYGKGSDQAQRLDSIFGKIIRIDPRGNDSANGQYGIPDDNPYANDGDPDTLDEIYASGFRNAHRIAWDSVTGTLLTTDIGQHDIEEVNIVHSGANYGWSNREGTFVYNGTISIEAPNTDGDPYTYPVAQYDHDDGIDGDAAIAGGFVYRGSRIPELQGKFVYGDIVTGRLFYSDLQAMLDAEASGGLATAPVYELLLSVDGEVMSLGDLILDVIGEDTLPNDRVDLRFGQTDDGEIYIMTKQDGVIRALVPEPGTAAALLAVGLGWMSRRRDRAGHATGSHLRKVCDNGMPDPMLSRL